jgi:hypothetical protein
MAGPKRPTRLLLAYATQQEAINHLVDAVPPSPEELAKVAARWQGATSALATGGPRPPVEPEPRSLPAALEDWAERISSSAQFQFLLGSLQPEFAMLSISRLIAIQKFVYSDANSQDAPNAKDELGLFQLTTPEPRLTARATIKDEASLSYTMASENPNLRVGGMAESDVMVTTPSGGQMPLHVFGYFATYGGPWMQVARLQGRWFLRDGYHRAYNLLQHGVDRVPCVVVSAGALADLGFVRAGFVGPEVLLGDRPPRVGDFVDDNVAVNGSIIPVRKVGPNKS